MTPDQPLTLNGVRDGQPCWVVPYDRPTVPIPVAAAVLRETDDAVVLRYRDRNYLCCEVFASEADARAAAYSRAESRHRSHSEAAARWACVLAALADEAPVVVELEDE